MIQKLLGTKINGWLETTRCTALRNDRLTLKLDYRPLSKQLVVVAFRRRASDGALDGLLVLAEGVSALIRSGGPGGARVLDRHVAAARLDRVASRLPWSVSGQALDVDLLVAELAHAVHVCDYHMRLDGGKVRSAMHFHHLLDELLVHVAQPDVEDCADEDVVQTLAPHESTALAETTIITGCLSSELELVSATIENFAIMVSLLHHGFASMVLLLLLAHYTLNIRRCRHSQDSCLALRIRLLSQDVSFL